MNNIKNKELLIALGLHIRELRKKKGLTMQELADDAGIEYKQLANVELGKINTSVSTVHAISKALDVPLEKIFRFKI